MLDLSSTAMTGTLPSELGNLTNLKRLMLSHSRFDGRVPPEVFALTSLEKFHLTNNDFNGTLPSEIGQMKNVKEFMVQFCVAIVEPRYVRVMSAHNMGL
jgi:Leucine-rich repeat (LRR) protein